MTREDAMLAAIAGEDAAVYGYGVLGARLPQSQAARAIASLDIHRARANSLRATMVAGGGQAPQAAAAYDLPFPVEDAASAARLAAHVENRLAAVYAQLAGTSSDEARREAVLVARECAVRAISWGAAPMAFPG